MYDADVKEDGQMLKGLQIMARKVLADDKVELKYKIDATALPKYMNRLPNFFIQPMNKIGAEWKCGLNKPYTPDWDNGSQPEPDAS
jgi:hypothetical protein